MRTDTGVRRVYAAREVMRLKKAGVPVAERFRVAARNGSLRAAIFGVNDGLVSNLALVMGVAGAGSDRAAIVLAGVAGLLAGALSMGAGEYLSMRVQREVGERIIEDERTEIARDPAGERSELAAIYRQRGFSDRLSDLIATEAMATPALALEAHRRDELALDDIALGSPWAAALSSFVTFSVGAAVPLLPILLLASIPLASVLVSVATLLIVGGASARMGGRKPAQGALRMAAIGAGAAAATYAIGLALGATVL